MPPKLWDVCIAPGTPPQTVAKFRAASKALDALILAEGLPTPDPNRWCWPHSEAMNDAEAAIAETGCLPADLIEAAMRVCDRHGDGEAAREEMRADCLALAPHLRADLLAHFRGTRQAAKGKP